MENKTTNKDSRVLIVDDDFSVRDFLDRFLKKKGFIHVQSASNGQEGLNIVEKEDIKIVLLDVKMPGMDGLEVLYRIKSIKPDVGVIMISGFPEEDLAKQAMKEGAYDYIIKPFDLAYLEVSMLTKIALM